MHGQIPLKAMLIERLASYTWLCHGIDLLPVEVEEREGGIILSTTKRTWPVLL